jgi:hypothetical protein
VFVLMLIIFVFLYYFGFAASVLLTGRFNSGVRPHLFRNSRKKFVYCWIDHRGHREHGGYGYAARKKTPHIFCHDDFDSMECLIPWLQPSGYPALRLHALLPFGGLRLVQFISCPSLVFRTLWLPCRVIPQIFYGFASQQTPSGSLLDF